MTIGERRIVAQVREKQQAQAEFQAAKAAGKSAALLEQHRPNVFKMDVANIQPGDEIDVELQYTELIVPTDSVYHFVFPTVVGPRYTSSAQDEASAARWQSNPYLHAGEMPRSDFNLSIALHSGIAIKQAASPSHQVQIQYLDARRARVELLPQERQGGNRDFILDYRLAGDTIESGLLLYEGPKENFFVAMIEPPRRVSPAQIPPRDYVFIVDVSGSMSGFPLNVTKALMRDLLTRLKPTDTFNVLLFAGASSLLSPTPLLANAENIARSAAFIDSQQGGGGTELLPALQRALALPGSEDHARSVVVVTDGYVDVETRAFDLIRDNLGRANLFAFGIGSGVNRYLIEGMAHVGQGEPFIVTAPEEAAARAAEFRRYIEAPVLTKAQFRSDDFEIYDVEPASVPDVLATRPVLVFGKWRGARHGKVRLTGTSAEGAFERAFDVATIKPTEDNAALRYLWARNRIASLSDYERLRTTPERIEQITQLGLQYNLLTAYTSFIAVDQVVRNEHPEQSDSVRQPLPLPQGVSDLAVGGEVPTTPEPELVLLNGVAGAMAAWQRRRKKKANAP
jgi:Ca-activated chloride channel family protein